MSNTKLGNNEPRPTKESFEEICRVLNQSRPYRSSDAIKQHFIPNFAETPEQAALYRACNESFIKTY
jgi:hypothetical protein